MNSKTETMFLLVSDAKLNIKNYFVFLNNQCIKSLKKKNPDQECENEKAASLVTIPINSEWMLKFVSSRENLFSIGLKQLLTPSKDISIENLKF